MITLTKKKNQAFSNKFEDPDFSFLWGSESLQNVKDCCHSSPSWRQLDI